MNLCRLTRKNSVFFLPFNAVPRPGLEPGPLDLESSTLSGLARAPEGLGKNSGLWWLDW